MICLGKPYRFKFFKGCLPQILVGPFLNTLLDPYNIFDFIRFSVVALVIFILYYVDYGQDGKPNQAVKNLGNFSLLADILVD